MSHNFLDQHENIKHVGDAISITITVGAIVNFLPAVAALLTIVWTAIRILETKTIQKAIGKWTKKHSRKD